METKKVELIDNMVRELRRGTIVISVLSQLQDQAYGYNLVNSLSEKGFNIEADTLYPLLRRLENQGLLESSWDTSESRPRKYYKISALGQDVYQSLLAEFENLYRSITRLTGSENNETD
ncbi:MAG TPA: PadR family transcriptional regulator [Firmicutes bacterium]|jgi:DNA-binding PadR family transcriptional regulator|nr:PadR family transcriptional regulator [Bacillota bacterium]HAW69720.1 PadR family transcriptional regulator [Bacillota bacterium]HAZ21468.1 PadR family transcriptional regulator [Bacillota bacterium]HBE05286.1 PadR family transcriptional regulator [Bacillota bacterium]HBG43769.1 PadR family transcriptional regulator [Bacillota bacterium]